MIIRLLRRASGATVGGSASITINTATYARGTAGVAPDLNINATEIGGTPNYTLFWATRSVGTPLTKSAIENGTGNALDNGSTTGATLAALSGSLDFSTSLASGAIDVFIRDSNSAESDVTSATGVDYDAVSPGFGSAVVENAAPSDVVITIDKAFYGTPNPADFTLTGFTVSTATRTNSTTITLGLSSPVSNGDDLTGDLSYTGTNLVGIDGEVMPPFANQNVTNNVAADSVITVASPFTYNVGDLITAPATDPFILFGQISGGNLVVVNDPTHGLLWQQNGAGGRDAYYGINQNLGANHYVEVDVVFNSTANGARLRCRVASDSADFGANGYEMNVWGNGQVYRDTSLGSTFGLVAGTKYTMRFTRTGSDIVVTLDSAPFHTFTGLSGETGGFVTAGVRLASGIAADGVQITRIQYGSA